MTKPKYTGRRKPYTEIGIGRVPCVKCGKPSGTQWQVCANNRLYLGLCWPCDVKLNRMVLKWAGIPNVGELMLSYEKEG